MENPQWQTEGEYENGYNGGYDSFYDYSLYDMQIIFEDTEEESSLEEDSPETIDA